jgi:hypothetical protein
VKQGFEFILLSIEKKNPELYEPDLRLSIHSRVIQLTTKGKRCYLPTEVQAKVLYSNNIYLLAGVLLKDKHESISDLSDEFDKGTTLILKALKD